MCNTLKAGSAPNGSPASVIFPQWSNPIVTRGLANLLLSCETRSRRTASTPVTTTFPSNGQMQIRCIICIRKAKIWPPLIAYIFSLRSRLSPRFSRSRSVVVPAKRNQSRGSGLMNSITGPAIRSLLPSFHELQPRREFPCVQVNFALTDTLRNFFYSFLIIKK